MSGRHRIARPSPQAKRAAVVVGALLGVMVAATATIVAMRGGLDKASEACSGELQLPVAVAPAIEPAVVKIAEEYQRSRPIVEGQCVLLQVTARNPADMAGELPAGVGKVPALWISDSLLWAQRTQAQAAAGGADLPQLEIRPSIATSPLVIAATTQNATKLGWPSGQQSWRRVVDGGVPAVIGDPVSTTEGLVTLMLVRSMFGNPDGTPKPELVAALLRVGKDAVPSIQAAFSRAEQNPAEAPAFSTTEQSVVENNRRGGSSRVVAVYPDEGTLNFDYPVVRMAARNEPKGTSAAADLFEQALRTPSATKALAEAGFRDSKGQAPSDWTEKDGVRSAVPALLPLPSPEQSSEVLRTWAAVTLESRMLTVIDVSGSMAEKAGNGQTRIELARDAAAGALAMLPERTHLGLWVFSTGQAPGQPWAQLVPLGPLSEVLEGNTRRAALQASVAGLPARVRGNTALYDTMLAAFRTVRRSYNPSKVNSVVLITDGANDNKSGVDLSTLLQTLRAESDPAQPVPIIPIGLGPDADMNALRQIAAATGGKAYQALQPEDIRAVLLDALIQRRCRPNC